MINWNFKNKLVLITASSKGIGFQLAKEFAQSNAKVAICSRSKKNLVNARNKILKFKPNANIKFFKCDISKVKNINSLYKNVIKSFNSNIDILVNNSGGPKLKKVMQTNNSDWENTLNSNLKSFIYMSQRVIPGMKKKNWGRIINLTSMTAKEPAAKMVLSNVSRAGVVAFSKTLSKEIQSSGITVNSILTGSVLTDRLLQLIKLNHKNKSKQALKSLANSIPVKRISDPKEFSQLVLFLCTDNASFINGNAISVDGGLSKAIF